MTATQVTRTKTGVFLNMEIERMEAANFAAEKQAARDSGEARRIADKITVDVISGVSALTMLSDQTAYLTGISGRVIASARRVKAQVGRVIIAESELGADVAAGFQLYLEDRTAANRAAKGGN